MSTKVELGDQHVSRAVPAGLQPFGALPAWLEAAAQPERMQSALARSILAFAAGELKLQACEMPGLRFKARTQCWTGAYRLTVAGSQLGLTRSAGRAQRRVLGALRAACCRLAAARRPVGGVRPVHARAAQLGSSPLVHVAVALRPLLEASHA
jgi:hypothetical protein